MINGGLTFENAELRTDFIHPAFSQYSTDAASRPADRPGACGMDETARNQDGNVFRGCVIAIPLGALLWWATFMLAGLAS